MNFTANRYTRAVIKQLWLVIVAAVVAGGVAYFIRSRQLTYYQAETRLLVGSMINSPDPDIKQLEISIRLAGVYTNLINYQLMTDVIDAFDLTDTPEGLRSAVFTEVLTNTPIMIVRVVYQSPETAVAIANYIAQYLAQSDSSSLTDEQQHQLDSLTRQIADLEAQVSTANGQAIAILEELKRAEASQDAPRADRLNIEYQRVANQLTAAQAVLVDLTASYTELSHDANQIKIIESAHQLNGTVGLSAIALGITGAVAGAILGLSVLLLSEHSIDTLRTEDELADALALPLVGWISRSRSVGYRYKDMLVTERLPDSQIAEDYRRFRVSMQSRRHDKKLVYLVTSAGVSEGKSLSVSNLAVSMALSGAKVLLIDADMRRPVLHKMFQLTNETGLTMLLNGGGDEQLLRQAVQETHVSGLWVLPSGSALSYPGEAFASEAMQTLLDSLAATYGFDVILIDTPPCLVVSDTWALAGGTSASVILVVAAGRTPRAAAIKAKQQFEQLGADIAGVVFNRARSQERGYVGSTLS